MAGTTVRRTAIAVIAALALAAALAACGSSSSSSSSSTSSTDPVSMALQIPGVRTILLAKQRNDITIIVPPCPQEGQQSAGQPSAGVGSTKESGKAPAGSSQIIVPKGALTETVAVQPCPPPPSGGSSGPTGASGGGGGTVSAIVMTPGGTTPQSPQQTQTQQNQLVVPENSSITTLVVPPCTSVSVGPSGPTGATGASGATGPTGPTTRGQVLPADSKSVTAPSCTIPQQQQSSG